MTITQKAEPRVRKNILLVDHRPDLESSLKPHLNQLFENSAIAPILIRAKDGPDAASKTDNQKFDILLIDTDIPRLMDGGFVHGIKTFKNTQNAKLMVMSERDNEEIPEALRHCHFFKKPVNTSTLIHSVHEALQTTPNKNSKFSVDARVLNSIIKSTVKVFHQFGCTKIQMGKANPLIANSPLQGDVSSLVDIISDSFRGQLSLSFDNKSFIEIASLMLKEEQSGPHSDNQDAVGEITSIIFGNAKAEITDFNIHMTIPQITSGKMQTLQCPAGSAGISLPFSTEKGLFYVSIIAYPKAA